jgi:hypothetical protein
MRFATPADERPPAFLDRRSGGDGGTRAGHGERPGIERVAVDVGVGADDGLVDDSLADDSLADDSVDAGNFGCCRVGGARDDGGDPER